MLRHLDLPSLFFWGGWGEESVIEIEEHVMQALAHFGGVDWRHEETRHHCTRVCTGKIRDGSKGSKGSKVFSRFQTNRKTHR